MLAGCPNLTRLQLVDADLTDVPEGGVLDSVSCLVNLRQLVVEPTHPADVSGATLRSNKLEYVKLMLSHGNLLQLGKFSSLQALHLWTADDIVVGADIVPGLMLPASLTALFLLSPVQAAFLSLARTTLQRLTIQSDVEGPAERPGSLLSGLDRFKHLTCLDLAQSRAESFLCPPPGPTYSALTASSSLVHLFLQLWDPVGMHGIWKYVFPSGRKLPDLKVIGFSCTSWGVADLRSLISCCPSLSDVFKLWLEPEVQVSELPH